MVLRETVGGVLKNVTPESGRITPMGEFGAALERTLSIAHTLRPKEWAESTISCQHSTRTLNRMLRSHAEAAGKEWTRDIAQRTNCPDLAYVRETDRLAMEPYNRSLTDFVLPVP